MNKTDQMIADVINQGDLIIRKAEGGFVCEYVEEYTVPAGEIHVERAVFETETVEQEQFFLDWLKETLKIKGTQE